MNVEPTGSPWIVDENEEATVVISTDVMKIKVHGKFRQRERKLFVLLIHSAWDELRNETRHTIEVAKIRDVFREVAKVKNFDDWLWDYLNREQSEKVGLVQGDREETGSRSPKSEKILKFKDVLALKRAGRIKKKNIHEKLNIKILPNHLYSEEKRYFPIFICPKDIK